MKSSKALEWLADAARQAKLERDLRALVEISSHTSDRAGTTAVAAQYEAQLRALCPSGALRITRTPSARFGDHLVARTDAAGPLILLVGHHDTVFPAATFSVYREDGALLRGPGVLDMKGGLTVIAHALSALDHAGVLAELPIAVVSVADEEVGSPEGRAVLLALCEGARAALVFESGRKGYHIITQSIGTGAVNVCAHGKAAHAGNAHAEGINAIWALARFVDRAQQLTDYDRGVTINVGRIEGGMGKNTVPDTATAELDLRYVTSADGEALVSAIDAACRAAETDVPGSRIDRTGGMSRKPLERTAASAELAALYGRAAREEGLGDVESPLLGGGSDANTVAEVGVPAIDGLGPRGKGFHTLDEQVERATLLPKARALVRAIVALASP